MTSQNAGPATTRPRKAAGTLEVPGAHLYYETWGFEGSGNPLLLLIRAASATPASTVPSARRSPATTAS